MTVHLSNPNPNPHLIRTLNQTLPLILTLRLKPFASTIIPIYLQGSSLYNDTENFLVNGGIKFREATTILTILTILTVLTIRGIKF